MEFIYQAFGSLLRAFYDLANSYGFALILFAVVAKLILLPFEIKGKRGMLDVQLLQPRMAELQKKYAKDKNKYNQAVQKLYEDEQVKPMSGCLWSFLPFPVILILYAVLRQPLSYIRLHPRPAGNSADPDRPLQSRHNPLGQSRLC